MLLLRGGVQPSAKKGSNNVQLNCLAYRFVRWHADDARFGIRCSAWRRRLVGVNAMALSPKHRIFCGEYLKCWNATDAYRAAYPKSSRESARASGARLLANVSIAEEIQRRVDEQTMTANEVLVRLAEQGRAEYAKYLQPNGTVDLAAVIRDGKAHLVHKVKVTQWGTNVEFYDAHAAKELIGKHHRLFVDKVDVRHSGNVTTSEVHTYLPDNGRNDGNAGTN